MRWSFAPHDAAVKEREGALVAPPGQADFTVGSSVLRLVGLALVARGRAGDPVDAVEPGLDAFAPSPARTGRGGAGACGASLGGGRLGVRFPVSASA